MYISWPFLLKGKKEGKLSKMPIKSGKSFFTFRNGGEGRGGYHIRKNIKRGRGMGKQY